VQSGIFIAIVIFQDAVCGSGVETIGLVVRSGDIEIDDIVAAT